MLFDIAGFNRLPGQYTTRCPGPGWDTGSMTGYEYRVDGGHESQDESGTLQFLLLVLQQPPRKTYFAS